MKACWEVFLPPHHIYSLQYGTHLHSVTRPLRAQVDVIHDVSMIMILSLQKIRSNDVDPKLSEFALEEQSRVVEVLITNRDKFLVSRALWPKKEIPGCRFVVIEPSLSTEILWGRPIHCYSPPFSPTKFALLSILSTTTTTTRRRNLCNSHTNKTLLTRRVRKQSNHGRKQSCFYYDGGQCDDSIVASTRHQARCIDRHGW